MSAFDTFVVVDWSGGNQTAAAPAANAIWAATARDGVAEEPRYFRNRLLVEDWLNDLVQAELDAERRLCLCFDFPFAYPAGFAQALTGEDDPFNVWAWFAERVRDAPNTNNRFDLAGELNRALADGRGPFWGNGLARDIPGLPRTMADYANPFPSHRNAEELAPGAFTCWQMSGAGAVGGQVMMGLPVLHRLRRRFAPHVAAWPFEALDKPVALVEVWPSLIRETIAELRQPNEIPDRAQVRVLAQALSRLSPEVLGAMLNDGDALEGSILGLGHKDALRAAALNAQPLSPPPLRNDCFALPAGVDWTPVDDALALLRDRLTPVTGTEEVSLSDALGRVLAGDAVALRSNPPQANTAVDGYGFAGPALEGPHEMPLVPGRAAAGVPFAGRVPPGHAIRVLTGAALPEGVDTVILDEDTTTDGARIAFRGPLKQGANTRRAGEDMA
ncbi:MAG: molybdopterin molybdenumtransferase MoeA, partial [Rhodobacteraceae bacterium]